MTLKPAHHSNAMAFDSQSKLNVHQTSIYGDLQWNQGWSNADPSILKPRTYHQINSADRKCEKGVDPDDSHLRRLTDFDLKMKPRTSEYEASTILAEVVSKL
ncbi:hypothetical protein AVEN_208511-1 [Araneus ventricosus]|uniref:Uncharacterized protein n=1 Tax=Araneus ventricosus TaxID=182803 RepID=A0A4Y2E776_ARAVE|nr:hypothetical protein AVEN_208511-1 [Araneus ventricosus]